MLTVPLRLAAGLLRSTPASLSFIFTVWFFLGMQGSIRGCPPVDLTEISTPERHLKLHWLRGRQGTSHKFVQNDGTEMPSLFSRADA